MGPARGSVPAALSSVFPDGPFSGVCALLEGLGHEVPVDLFRCPDGCMTKPARNREQGNAAILDEPGGMSVAKVVNPWRLG